MDINRVSTGAMGSISPSPAIKTGATEKTINKENVKSTDENHVVDSISLNSKDAVSEDKPQKSSNIYKVLEQPSGNIEARNRTPVVIVHGTMSEENSIEKYKDAALGTGHPVDLKTYMTIKDGHRLEESGQILSQQINEDRIQSTGWNLQELNKIKNNPDKLKEFFKIDSNIYGDTDKSTDQILKLIPGVIEEINGVMKLPESELKETFSTRVLNIENALTDRVSGTSFGSQEVNSKKREEICGKVSREIVNSIAPRVILVGHSMGGFLSYTQALNPRQSPEDRDGFRYDGGNGISTVMTLSSPVGKGVATPLPRALADLSYNLLEKHYYEPLEKTPGMQLSMLNPFFAAWYVSSKAATKLAYRASAEMSAKMMNPMIYAQKPGYEQIAEGSSFIKEYVKDKKVPEGITAIAVSSKDDGVSEQDRSGIEVNSPNAHNLDAEANVKPEELTKFISTVPSMAHIKMAQQPTEHWQEFLKENIENPEQIPQLLHRSNDDGFRWNCLQVLLTDVKKDPGFFEKPGYEEALNSIKDVAEERLPFTDSPSYVAKQILDELKGIETVPSGQAPGNWMLAADVNPI